MCVALLHPLYGRLTVVWGHAAARLHGVPLGGDVESRHTETYHAPA